eukprot:6180277-Pleurochrysis_carterae.AAC.1
MMSTGHERFEGWRHVATVSAQFKKCSTLSAARLREANLRSVVSCPHNLARRGCQPCEECKV